MCRAKHTSAQIPKPAARNDDRANRIPAFSGAGEKSAGKGRKRQSNRLSDAWCGEQDRLEMAGVIGDTTRDRGRRTEGAAVNYSGLNFRRK